jgi:hypothetical protein
MSTALAQEHGSEKRFDWPVCYRAEGLLLNRCEEFLRRNGFTRELAQRMRDQTGTLFFDWVDYLGFPASAEAELGAAGFKKDSAAENSGHVLVLCHPEALLPRVLLTPSDAVFELGIRVESVVDFLVSHRMSAEAEGAPLSRFGRVCVSCEHGTRFAVVERRGYRGFVPDQPEPHRTDRLLKARELWQIRNRYGSNTKQAYADGLATLDRLLDLVGQDVACHLVFEVERAYWQSRNRAAQVQKQRQDALGLGWANHDHHTFRSSREHFLDLMSVLEKLGFQRRERYYAGAEAGWGAQILEQPVEGIVVFADVDLMPNETEIDFSRQALPPAGHLGTVGLWVALHGESFLEAGMHHLEARFDFRLVREQLKQSNIFGMPPFSDFDFLRQAFTEGERWTVAPEKIEHLRRSGLITDEQAKRFLTEGAIGSHLETLQRKGGFKGFNQKSVSAIISATDPRGSQGGARRTV